jgi:hypothetical protein
VTRTTHAQPFDAAQQALLRADVSVRVDGAALTASRAMSVDESGNADSDTPMDANTLTLTRNAAATFELRGVRAGSASVSAQCAHVLSNTVVVQVAVLLSCLVAHTHARRSMMPCTSSHPSRSHFSAAPPTRSSPAAADRASMCASVSVSRGGACVCDHDLCAQV